MFSLLTSGSSKPLYSPTKRARPGPPRRGFQCFSGQFRRSRKRRRQGDAPGSIALLSPAGGGDRNRPEGYDGRRLVELGDPTAPEVLVAAWLGEGFVVAVARRLMVRDAAVGQGHHDFAGAGFQSGVTGKTEMSVDLGEGDAIVSTVL